jgi:AraC family transcriptional activator of pobA
LVTRGGGCFHAEGETNSFNQSVLISVPLACVHGFDFKPGTDGWILTASGALIERIAHENAELRAVLSDANAMPLPADVTAAMVARFEALMMEFRSNLPGRRTAAEALLIGILVAALRRKLQLLPNKESKIGADSVLASTTQSDCA